MEKSIIIIGGGLTGLSAGCYARMNGYIVRIFEMHKIPGGLCTSWKRKGYTFDGCITWLMDSHHGIFHRFYEELGATQDRPMINHDEYIRIEGLQGKTWIVYSNLERLEQHMKELAPADAEVIKTLCKAARLAARYEMPLEKPIELMGIIDLFKMLKKIGTLRALNKYNKISTQDFASRFSDPFLREAFPYMLDEMQGFSIRAPLNALASSHEHNGGWPTGGSLEFARAIEKRYLGLGGEIHYKSTVEKILVENGRAVGIRLADGTEHYADIIISAADGRTTIFNMLNGEYLDDKIRSYYNEWPIYQPIIQISLGIARDLSNEPHSVTFYLDEPIKAGDQERHWLHMEHHCFDSTMAPPGKSVVTVRFMNTNHAYWKKLYEDSEHYKAEKKILADTVIDRLEKRFPGIKEQIEVVDVATPVTFERYTGNWQGSYMGWADTTEIFEKMMSKTLKGLDSFYMAGHWVRFGGGVPGSITSGRHVVQIICKKDKKKFVTSTP